MADTTDALSTRPPTQESFHPIDSKDAGDPDAKLAELRGTCPVSHAHRDGYPDVTVVTKYGDVTDAFRRYRAIGNIGSDPDPARHDATPLEERTIIALDPPTHTWARRLNNLAMAPGLVDEALPYVEQQALELVDAFASKGEGDIVADLAEPLPSRAIARVLGLPEDDCPKVHGWVSSVFTESAAHAAGQLYGSITVVVDFEDYLRDQIALRHNADAPDDAIKRMVDYRRDDGSAFTDTEIIVQIRTLLHAGNETTTSLISNVLYRILMEPGLYERVVADRSLVGPAIEESLRLDAPLQVIIRRANEDVTIGGQQIEAGEVLALSTLSANRDEEVWGETAGQFDIERFNGGSDAAHVGFGLGIHHCVGAYLARQTTTRGVNALLDRIPSMKLVDDYQYENVFRHVFHRPKTLPVRFPT